MSTQNDLNEDIISFVSAMSQNLKEDITVLVETFTQRHQHRPIGIVTSGGTAADLECNAVRSLENFSTGLRGAIAVEQLIHRGYAVIHLCREGSASPYARVLNRYLGLKQSNFSLDVSSLGNLYTITGEPPSHIFSYDEEEKSPWLSESESFEREINPNLIVNNNIIRNSYVQKALMECSIAITEGKLLTIYFRTVEDYLGKLQLLSELVSVSSSLCMIILAAAVSDFYIPKIERAEHKIQSSANDGRLTLTLHPVPKVLGLLRKKWAPYAFIVSFKLETDINILRSKAEMAAEKYGCHIVVGNILQTRHENVWILSPLEPIQHQSTSSVKDWSFTEIKKEPGNDPDSLETSIVDYLVTSHFEYLSCQYHVNEIGRKETTGLSPNIHPDIKKRRKSNKKLQQNNNGSLSTRLQNFGFEIVGAAIAFFISYTISSVLRGRIRSYS